MKSNNDKLMKLATIVVSYLLFFAALSFSSGWPLKDAGGSEVGIITDEYSSGRDTGIRDGIMDEFHGGVDIVASSGGAHG